MELWRGPPTAPPWVGTLFNLPPEKNPIHWPSGERKWSRALGPSERYALQLVALLDLKPGTLVCPVFRGAESNLAPIPG